MKFRATQKEIKENYTTIAIPYCAADSLLYGMQATAYTAGVYGWNADVYIFDNNVAFVTGYRPFGIKADYETVKRYNDAALCRIKNSTCYGDLICKLNELRIEFISEVTKK